MKRNLYRLFVSACFLGALWFLLKPSATVDRRVRYTIEEIPIESPFPETPLEPFISALNNRGEVAGTLAAPGLAVAFVWSPREGTAFFPLRGEGGSVARDLNDRGVAAGSFRRPDEPPRSFAWAAIPSASETIAVGFPGTEGKGINLGGVVIGSYESPEKVHHAFVWSASLGMTAVKTPGNDRVFHARITDDGVGALITENQKTYRWIAGASPDHWADVGGPMELAGLNRSGVLAGTRRSPDPFLFERFDLYRGYTLDDSGTARDLDTAGATSTRANDIDDAGRVVGSHLVFGSVKARELEGLGYVDAVFGTDLQGDSYYHTRPRAVMWEKGSPIDLNDEIPPDSGWTLEEAASINNRGEIVGRGRWNGRPAVFLLKPLTSEGP